MNRRTWYKSWVLVWGTVFFVGGLILYTGYLSTLSESSQEKAKAIITTQTVSSKNSEGPTDKVRAVKVATQLSIPKNSGSGKDILGEEIKASKQVDGSIRVLDKKDFPSPVKGNVLRSIGNYYSEVFNNYLFHAGMDYAEPEGAMIRATHGGKVIYAGSDSILGQKVVIDCGERWMVTYGGLDNLRVHSGEIIEAQKGIGQVGFFPGAEGTSGQPQLHYEVWHGDDIQWPEPQN